MTHTFRLNKVRVVLFLNLINCQINWPIILYQTSCIMSLPINGHLSALFCCCGYCNFLFQNISSTKNLQWIEKNRKETKRMIRHNGKEIERKGKSRRNYWSIFSTLSCMIHRWLLWYFHFSKVSWFHWTFFRLEKKIFIRYFM